MRIESPNGDLAVVVAADTEAPSSVTYQLHRGDTVVLDPSVLGLELADDDLSELQLTDAGEPEAWSESYSLIHGKQLEVDAQASRRTLRFISAEGVEVEVDFHVADDGMGFRYRLPNVAENTLRTDLSSFAFAADGKAWIQPHDLPGYAEPAYEAPYSDGIRIGHSAPVPGWALPALFETGTTWVLLAESNLGPGGYGARLDSDVDGREYRLGMPHPAEGLATTTLAIEVDAGWESSWRVMIVGELATVVESTLITDLARPAQMTDTSWIRPGRVSWSWWSEHDSPRDPGALRRYIDLAADMGWEHTLIDANWNLLADGVIEDVIGHADDRGVGVFLWYNSGGPNNQVTEQPRDRMFDPETRRAEFARLRELGVAGVKVDFFHSDRPEIIDLYLGIMRDAADHQVMVNFHGSTVPRGWNRTWPHLMTMEAVRGAEQYSFRPSYPEEAVWHNSILPYTRNAIGPMDYTPTTFSNQMYPRLTLDGHELALAVVFESGLQHLADNEASYRSQPDSVIELLRDVPAVWDETRLLAGYPGDFTVIARRSGDLWWIGAINGTEARTIELDLSFLAGSELSVVGDPNWSADLLDHSNSTVTVTMPAAGGWVGRTSL